MPKCMRCMEDYEGLAFCPRCGTENRQGEARGEELPSATILNKRFIVGELISQDRIGFTYIAWDALLERRVAIKEWYPKGFSARGKDGAEVTFQMEKKLSATLQKQFLAHAMRLNRMQTVTALVNIYASFEENGTAYYVMEYLEGQSLRDLLKKENPLELQKAEEIMDKVFEALQVIHEKGMLHGNLNPDNIFLCRDGSVKFLNSAWCSSAMETMKYTIFLGKYADRAYYNLPLKADASLDMYSAYAVYYRLLTGQEPVSAYERERGKKLPDFQELGIVLPPELEQEILGGLGIEEKTAGRKSRGKDFIFKLLSIPLGVTAAVLGILLLI